MREHDAAQDRGRSRGRAGIDPPARVHVRAVLGDVREQLGARLRMSVRLRELHDGAVRLAGHEERFFPLRIAHVDVHRMEARAAHPFDRGGEVGDLERQVVRARAVARDEPGEEVVLLGLPRFEQLDRHAVAGVGAEPHLHRPEADAAGRRR